MTALESMCEAVFLLSGDVGGIMCEADGIFVKIK